MTTEPTRAARLHRDPRALALAGVTLLITSYLVSPNGVGQIAFLLAGAGGSLAFVLGPPLRRPQHAGPWRWLMAAGAAFLVSLAVRMGLVDAPGLLGNPELWSMTGYVCSVAFVYGLLRRTGPTYDPTLWLDTAAVATGSVIVGWVMSIAPALLTRGSSIGEVVIYTAYPVLDALLVTLSVQLAFRRGMGNLALESVVVGMICLLIGDTAYTVILATSPGELNPYANAVYMVAYVSLGLSAVHPSMRELSDVRVSVQPRITRGRLLLMLVAVLVPASVPILLPTRSSVDGVVRAFLMAILGGLVFARIVHTMRALRRAEAEVHRRATHDVLTGLPNRMALLEDLERYLPSSARDGVVAVLIVDCDNFKRVNDSWGMAAGNDVLLACRNRLGATLQNLGDVYRIGGDEFAVVVSETTIDQAVAIAQRVVETFQEPIAISSNRSTLLTVSVGIATTSDDMAITAEELVLDADIALHSVKDHVGAGHAVYDASTREAIARRHRLADDLHHALQRGDLEVHFQPIHGGDGYRRLTGWEALVRWQHPELGAVPPLEFVPIAEDTGMILELGEFVLRTAVTQLRRWQEELECEELHVSVNVSAAQLLRVDLVALTRDILQAAGLAAHSLWLEVTESVQLEVSESAKKNLSGLNELGVVLCIDDFGTGYSSFGYVKDFSVDILKIERKFVKNLVHDERDRKITKAIVDLSRSLGLVGVVAVGVEGVEQAEHLTDMGCSMVQGYLYGKPMPPEEALAAARRSLGLDTDRSATLEVVKSSGAAGRIPSPRAGEVATEPVGTPGQPGPATRGPAPL